jgi:hypothetical protein
MAGIEMRIHGLERLLSKLTPELYRPAMLHLLTAASLLAERTAREGAPKDTSALSRSITSEVKPTSARVFSTLAYASVMEEGRRPGARMPPPDALRGWMGRHGLGNVAPFVIARGISRRGIKGRFFFKAAQQAVEHALPGLAEAAGRKVQEEWHR